jgi:hypothetical protein
VTFYREMTTDCVAPFEMSSWGGWGSWGMSILSFWWGSGVGPRGRIFVQSAGHGSGTAETANLAVGRSASREGLL